VDIYARRNPDKLSVGGVLLAFLGNKRRSVRALEAQELEGVRAARGKGLTFPDSRFPGKSVNMSVKRAVTLTSRDIS
jgi:hypothetical protein